jgi:hypothetical protein
LRLTWRLSILKIRQLMLCVVDRLEKDNRGSVIVADVLGLKELEQLIKTSFLQVLFCIL